MNLRMEHFGQSVFEAEQLQTVARRQYGVCQGMRPVYGTVVLQNSLTIVMNQFSISPDITSTQIEL